MELVRLLLSLGQGPVVDGWLPGESTDAGEGIRNRVVRALNVSDIRRVFRDERESSALSSGVSVRLQ